ncbi:putative ankyrin repeat protein RF_0381 [Leptopilina heterotoma]|uniref:putative ankyrin repeat protein RF_0381 n=1 Tax=Leptopilina heterotoma TaxID=63436 RepID=UPI001CAA2693|nr:putative ankyrin repeat protein RF_0381 [Leptopilina heterotoma]
MDISNDYNDTSGYNELFLAVHNGDLNLVHSLLEKYSATETIRGRTLLHVAAAGGHAEIATLLTTKRDETGNTPLHLAIMRNQPQVFNLLLEETNLNARNLKDERPLHYAALYNHSEFAKTLLDNGASIEVKDKEGKTPLYVALAKGNVQMSEILFKHGAVLTDNDLIYMGPLRNAVRRGNFEMVKLLMANGCRTVDIPTFDGSALKFAVSCGHLNILQYLIKNGEKSSETINKDELHLFKTSIQMKRLDILKYLVDIGLKTKTVSNTFFDIIKHRRYETWEYLLKHLSKINATTYFREKQLHFSVRMNQVETIKATVKELKIPLYQFIPFNRKLAVYIAAETGNEEILEILLNAGYPIDSVFKFITPLHVAATFEHPRLVKLLLKAGADVNLQTEDGLTPLHFAAMSVQPAVVKFLLENGADSCKTCGCYKEPPFGSAVAMFGTNLSSRSIPVVMFERLIKITKMLTTSTNVEEIDRLYLAAVTIRVLNINNLNQETNKVTWADYSEFRPEIIKCMSSYISDESLKINCEMVFNESPSGLTPELMQLMMDYDDSKSCCTIEINDPDVSYKCKLLMIGYSKNIDNLLSINKVEDFIFDIGYKFVKKDRTELVNLIVARLVLLTEDGHPGVLKYCLDNDVNALLEKCLKEKVDMQKAKVNENMIVTFYDVLTKSTNEVAMYASNCDFLKAIESSDTTFPVYADFLKTSVEVAEKRKEFINECTTLMFSLVQKCHKIRISRADIGHIFQYLSIIDLRRFSAVCS